MYVFSFILDDRISCSWWLGVSSIQFNIFCGIQCFDQNFERLLTSELNTIHPCPIIEETPTIVEQECNSKDEEEQAKVKPNLYIYIQASCVLFTST